MSTATGIGIQDWAARSRGWIGIFLLAPVCVAVVLSAPPSMEGGWVDFAFDQIAWLAFLVGALLRWWATLYIGGRKTSSLTCEGPYSLCRNPIYLGTFMMGLSVAIFLESLTFAAAFLLASWIYLSTTVPAEERRLQKRYGSEFSDYCQEVPRFLPRLKTFRSAPVVEVRIKGLFAEAIRAARWIWLPILCELVMQLRSQPNWPHTLHLP
jgi:protein-S-isoprenylcysteine O-methyltransferase Ste14